MFVSYLKKTQKQISKKKRRNSLKNMNSLKKGEGVPLLNFVGGTGTPLLNFEGDPGVQLLNFEGGLGSRVPGSRGPGSWDPGPTFTPCLK